MKISKIVELNQASQSREELGALLGILPPRERKFVVEIGVHRGYSLLNWRRAFNPDLLVGIEPNKWEISKLVTDQAKAEVLIGNSTNDHIVKTIELLCKDKGGIDYLFIDGDHHYEQVKKDFNTYKYFVKKGGEIVLHDVALKGHPDVEVYKLWDEIRHDYDHSTIHRGDTGFGLILNYE